MLCKGQSRLVAIVKPRLANFSGPSMADHKADGVPIHITSIFD